MTFNRGWKCEKCGPIEKAGKKTINKVTYNICPGCSHVVQAWERPMNERAGRCSNCGNAEFKLAVWKGDILRKCKNEECGEVYNVDQNKIARGGNKRAKIGS